MKTRARFCAVVLLLLVVCPDRALAFGLEGHRLICEIAFQRLSPAAKTFVNEVRALRTEIRDPFDGCQNCPEVHPSDARQMSFSEGCTWADEARRDTFKGTYEYHFINVPKAAAGFDLGRDCGVFDCVLVGIQRYARYLALDPSDSSREKERRVLALRFLGHFVGDLHQPLHTGFVEDLGGNLIAVRFTENGQTETSNLHAVWDSVVLRKAGLSPGSAQTLNSEITPADAAAFSTLDITGWATEAHGLARQLGYTKPDGNAVEANDLLDEDYFDPAGDAIRLQIKKAAVRLAALIEAAAAGTLPAQLLRVTTP